MYQDDDASRVGGSVAAIALSGLLGVLFGCVLSPVVLTGEMGWGRGVFFTTMVGFVFALLASCYFALRGTAEQSMNLHEIVSCSLAFLIAFPGLGALFGAMYFAPDWPVAGQARAGVCGGLAGLLGGAVGVVIEDFRTMPTFPGQRLGDKLQGWAERNAVSLLAMTAIGTTVLAWAAIVVLARFG